MITSPRGRALIESFESCRLKAYEDPRGIWTIGWGHTGPDVVAGLVWTQIEADAALAQDLAWAENIVNEKVTVALNQNQFDALVDFVFNVGSEDFEGSTLLSLLNQGSYAGAAPQFLRWDHTNGVVLPGLLRRRNAEMALFMEAA